MLFAAFVLLFIITYLLYTFVLKISGKIVGVRLITWAQCLILLIVPYTLLLTINLFFNTIMGDSDHLNLIKLAAYCIVEIGMIHWVLFGISLVRATVLFIVSQIILVAIVLSIFFGVYQANLYGFRTQLNNEISKLKQEEATGTNSERYQSD